MFFANELQNNMPGRSLTIFLINPVKLSMFMLEMSLTDNLFATSMISFCDPAVLKMEKDRHPAVFFAVKRETLLLFGCQIDRRCGKMQVR